MDIEDIAVKSLNGEEGARQLLEELLEPEVIEALLEEVQNSFSADGPINTSNEAGITAGGSGLGCRGEGDNLVHRLLVDILPSTGLHVSPSEMDDAGAVPFGDGYIVTAVDGLHSRLSRFPFLAGFHASRAALRDIMVKGAEPLAMISDVHLANDGDVGKVFDLTAGVGAVSLLTKVPVASGSTLRIGGDMVLGDRITGGVGAIGFAKTLHPRRDVREGDSILLTLGKGGGTIASTAIFNGHPEVIHRTLNIDFKRDIEAVSGIDGVRSMTDVTNGGIRGDSLDIVMGRSLDIIIEESQVQRMIDPAVLRMLDAVGIDPLGISTDSIMIFAEPGSESSIIEGIESAGGDCEKIGRVEPGWGRVFIVSGGERRELQREKVETPYTPVKRATSSRVVEIEVARELLEPAMRRAREKMVAVVREVRDASR